MPSRFVVERFNNRVQVFDKSGGHVRFIGSQGAGNGQFESPCGMEVAGGRVYVADSTKDNVQVFTLNGGFVDTIGSPGAGNGQLSLGCFTIGIAVHDGEIFVSDAGNDRIAVFDIAGNWERNIGVGVLKGPRDIEFDDTGTLWVTDATNDDVTRWSTVGAPLGSLGAPGATLGLFQGPIGVAIDPSGEPYGCQTSTSPIGSRSSRQSCATGSSSPTLAPRTPTHWSRLRGPTSCISGRATTE